VYQTRQAVVVTGAVIGAVGTVIAAIATILVGYFVRRTDQAAKATRANLEDQQYVMRLDSVIRDDYWTLADSWYALRGLYSEAREQLRILAKQSVPAPEFPKPRHRELEAKHARGEEMDDGDK
jgi:hypothetical protein